MTTIRAGISTCPNDTFAFHALIERQVDPRGIEFAFTYLDVQELNERVLGGELDVAKVSFPAALRAAGDLVVLPSGAALGFGVGPVLLGRPGVAWPVEDGRPPRVLCPGDTTTATLLWTLFHGERAVPRQVVFSDIMPALRHGTADLGVCIHEGRFTWRDQGLVFVEDLGERWERETGTALPLGGIVGRRTLGRDLLRRVQAALADSIAWGAAHRAACLPTMQRHAQELDADVLWAHVDLYVNAWTRDLGDMGRRALAELNARARTVGMVPADAPILEVFC